MSFPNVKAAWKKDFVYKTVGDLEISLTVWAPKQIKGTHPVIVQFHPGGLTGGNRFSWLPEYLQDEALDRGSVWVSADYRLLPTATGEEILSDLLDAYDWAITKLPGILADEDLGSVDKKRIGVVGLSAGGWCAAAVVDHHKDGPTPAKALYAIYPEAGVDRPYYNQYRPNDPIMGIVTPPPGEIVVRTKPVIAGIDLPDFTKSREAYKAEGEDALWFYDQNTYCLHIIQHIGYAKSLTGDEDLKNKLGASQSADERRKILDATKFRKFFPQLNCTKTWPPTVITHGAADTGVPCADSEFWAEELKRNGVKHLFVAVPDVDHGFDVGCVNEDSNPVWSSHLKKPVLYFLDELLLP